MSKSRPVSINGEDLLESYNFQEDRLRRKSESGLSARKSRDSLRRMSMSITSASSGLIDRYTKSISASDYREFGKHMLQRLKLNLIQNVDLKSVAKGSRTQVDNVQMGDRFGKKLGFVGTLYLTVSQVFFVDKTGTKEVWIVSKLISSVERLPITTLGSPLLIQCKHFLSVIFYIRSDRDCQDVYDTLLSLSYTESVDGLSCFTYKPEKDVPQNQGWHFFNVEDEYLRMGVPNDCWTVSYINKNYEVCDTYPKVLYVPTGASTPLLIGSSRFRSRGRLPVLTYLHSNSKIKNAALCRCSQPLAGFSARCLEDEQLLQVILRANPNQHIKSLYVVDTRPMINAAFNRAQGKGYENENVYKNIDFRFFDIDNIHVMRASLEKLLKACGDRSLDMSGYVSAVEKSGWLRHIRLIVEAGLFIAQTMDKGASVLVHCSDGWDRTAQTCSIAEILLNPHYRTIQGFQGLIEKEWLSFGHKFTDRCGLLDSVDRQEVSPVFIQFLECVWQLSCQFPAAFQFNERFLVRLQEEVMAAQYATFVGNCQKDRLDLQLDQRCYSLWGMFALHSDDFLNPIFSSEAFPGMLTPSLAPQLFTVWRGLYNRFDTNLHPHTSQLDYLTSLQVHNQIMGQHTALLEARVGQLCSLLGKSEEVTLSKKRGFAHSESLYTLKDMDPSGDESVVDRLVPVERSPSSPGDSWNLDNNDSSSGGDLLYLPEQPPTPECLLQEMSALCVNHNSLRLARACGRCQILFQQGAVKKHCPKCGTVVCHKCLRMVPTLPGLPPPHHHHNPIARELQVCQPCSLSLANTSRSVAGPVVASTPSVDPLMGI